jgi:uncharacterized protein
LRPPELGPGPVDDAPAADAAGLGEVEGPAGGAFRLGEDAPATSANATMPAGRVLQIILICLLVWLLLDATALKRGAEVSNIGARRTVALVVLTPLDAVSRFLQLDHLRTGVERLVGRRSSPGTIEIEPVPVIDEPDVGNGTGSRQPEELEGPLPEATSEHPLRVAIVGDSFAQGIGGSMGRAANRNTVNVQARGVLASGLTRPDYFNWAGALREIVGRFKPHVTVVMLGGNDWQSMTGEGGNPIPVTEQDRWRGLYLGRVEQFMRIATDAGSRVVWIGLPPSRDEFGSRQAHRLNGFYRQAAKDTPGVAYVDGWELFGGGQGAGNYRAYLPDESGRQQLVRSPDGEHLSSLGYDWVAESVLETLQQRWQLSGNYAR